MFATDGELGRGNGDIEAEDGSTDAGGDDTELRAEEWWLSTLDNACTVSAASIKFQDTWHTVEDVFSMDWEGLFIERLSRVF